MGKYVRGRKWKSPLACYGYNTYIEVATCKQRKGEELLMALGIRIPGS